MTYTAAMLRYQIGLAVSNKKLDWLTQTLAASGHIRDKQPLTEAITARRARIARGCISEKDVCPNHPA